MAGSNRVDEDVLRPEELVRSILSSSTRMAASGDISVGDPRVSVGDSVQFNSSVRVVKHPSPVDGPKPEDREMESVRQQLKITHIDGVGNAERSLWSEEFMRRLKTRSEWSARPAREPPEELITRPAPYVVVGHTVSQQNYTSFQDCCQQVRNVQMYHFSLLFSDIGYNFLVGGDGNVYEGRGWRHRGAHTRFFNAESIGVGFIGMFEKELPPEEQLQAFRLLLEEGVRTGELAPDYKMFLQRQLRDTESPGDALSRELMTWSHWRPYDEALYPRAFSVG